MIKEENDNGAKKAEKPKKEKIKKPKAGGGKLPGIFRFGVDSVSDKIYGFFTRSATGRFFTCRESFEKAENSSYFRGALSMLGKKLFRGSALQPKRINRVEDFSGSVGIYNENTLDRPLKTRINGAIESSRVLSALGELIRRFGAFPVMSLGIFLLTFGIAVIAVQSVKLFVSPFPADSVYTLFEGLVMLLLSVPVLINREETVGQAVRTGRISSFIVCSLAGVNTKQKQPERVSERPGIFMVAAGVFCGGLSYLFSPGRIIFFILVAVCALRVLVSPEFGVLLAVIAIPLLPMTDNPGAYFTALSLFISFSFFIKAAAGKRSVIFRFGDLLLLLFGLICIFSSMYDRDGASRALLYISLMLLGYVVRCVIRSSEWENRLVNCVIFSSVAVSVASIVSFTVFRLLHRGAVFGKDSGLVWFVSAAIIVTLARAISPRGHKPLCFAAFLVEAAAVVTLGSRLAIAMTLLGIVIFFMICSRRSLSAILLIILIIPLASCFVSGAQFSAFWRLLTFTDPSQAGKVAVWSVSSDMAGDFMIGGIGLSRERFAEIFSRYAPVDLPVSGTSMSLLLQILIQLGIIGLLFVIALMLVCAVRAFSLYRKYGNGSTHSVYAVGCFVALLTLMISGIFYDLWGNPGGAALFWVLFGAVSSFPLCAANEDPAKIDILEEYQCDINLEFENTEVSKAKTPEER